MNILGLVTARGGSKGFPGKNSALLGGKPLVLRSYEALAGLQARFPQHNFLLRLSTDYPEIQKLWPAPNRPVDLRPTSLALDTTSSMEVIHYELARADQRNFKADALLLLQPTSPLVSDLDLALALSQLNDPEDSIIGITPLDHPIQWALWRDSEGTLKQVVDPTDANRRQDLQTGYRPVGFYLVGRSFLVRENSLCVSGKSKSVIVPPSRGVDIDHPRDLAIANWYLEHPISQVTDVD